MTTKKAAPFVLKSEDARPQPVGRAQGARMAVLLGAEAGAQRFITRRFVIEAGGRIPMHRHDTIEHEQVVVRGEMVLSLDGVEHVVKAGDAVLIPAECAHAYENRGTEPVEFLCVVPNAPDYQTEWLEDPPPGAFMP